MSFLTRLITPAVTQVVEDAIDSFRTMGKRSVLALLGIVIGSGSIVAVINVGHNTSQEAAKIFQGMGVDTLFAKLNDEQRFKDSFLGMDAANIRGLDLQHLMVAPVSEVSGKAGFNRLYIDVRIVGTEPALIEVLKLSISRGRFLHEFDRDDNVVVLGHTVATSLSSNGLGIQVGEWLKINNYLFKVVGILQPAMESMLSPVLTNHSLFMPLQGLARVDSGAAITDVIMRVGPAQKIELVVPQVMERLSAAFKTRTVEIVVAQQMIDAMSRQNKTFHYLLIALGIITLVGGGVAVMNVMYMNVSERRIEIGLRMAIGARRQDIRNLFLVEALALSTLGAVLGAGVGIALAWLYAVISGWAFELAMLSIPLGVSSTLLVGVFFGLKPAIAASRLTPVEALRDY
ncbi:MULTISPECIES: ABC transporter permease [Pseudomonas]|uniref:ABC transporter permease n=1 Tax=Pseudomonas kulmbachensis TaxID=3043408 RepID=A0ABW7LVX5_9PSED|nr:ABC transporter permease [Pseudomonas fragi]UXL39399.1 ABC transporter permease [Pseudomonas fragi]